MPFSNKFTFEVPIDKGVEETWEIYRDFSNKSAVEGMQVPADKIKIVDEGKMNCIGAQRELYHMGGESPLIEELTKCDDTNKMFAYKITSPGPLVPFLSYEAQFAFAKPATSAKDGKDATTIVTITVEGTLDFEDPGPDAMPKDGEPPFATPKGFETFMTGLYTGNFTTWAANTAS